MARTSASSKGSPRPQAWLRTRLRCNLLQVFAAYPHIGQLAEAGVDAIGRFIAGDNALDHGLGTRQFAAGLPAQWLRSSSRWLPG